MSPRKQRNISGILSMVAGIVALLENPRWFPFAGVSSTASLVFSILGIGLSIYLWLFLRNLLASEYQYSRLNTPIVAYLCLLVLYVLFRDVWPGIPLLGICGIALMLVMILLGVQLIRAKEVGGDLLLIMGILMLLDAAIPVVSLSLGPSLHPSMGDAVSVIGFLGALFRALFFFRKVGEQIPISEA